MKTKVELTVIVSPRHTWGQESSSYAFAVREGAFRAVDTYQIGDLLIAGTNCKSMFGRVVSVEDRPDGCQAVRICSLGLSRGKAVMEFPNERIYERDLIPPHLAAGHNDGETLNGAYRSVIDGGDVSAEIPDDATVTSSGYGDMKWRDYRDMRRRSAEWKRVLAVREAIHRLRFLLLEERENPAIFERVFRSGGSGKADWFMTLSSGETHHVMDHDEDCPILSALEHQLYAASDAVS